MKRRRALLFTLSVVLALFAACGWWLHLERQQYALNRQLIDALENDDPKQAVFLLEAGADPNTRQSPLPAPTLPQLLKQLLHRSPPPANNSPTALLMACGAFWPTKTNYTIRWITLDENLPLIQAMLAHGANVHARESENRTALHDAVAYQRLPTVELLLQHGADVNVQDAQGSSPLALTAWDTKPNVARLLLTHGANPNAQDMAGNTALNMALFAYGNSSLVTELLAHGADPNLPDKQGATPLQYVRQMNRPDLVRLLKHRTR